MNADLTFNGIAFKKSFDNVDGSVRRDNTRGVNTPDILTIKRQSYTDSVTKVPGTRFLMDVSRTDVDDEAQLYVSRAYAVIQLPSTENTTDLATLVATFKAMVADADFVTDVLNFE